MQKVTSKQIGVHFMFVSSPTTIDKTAEWGPNPENIQIFPNGAFLKVNGDGTTISHGVQPNQDKTAPVGWMPAIESEEPGRYDKLPIFVDFSKIYNEGETIEMVTLDGKLEYLVKIPSVKVYNGSTEPNMSDGWVMTIKDLEKNYEVTKFITVNVLA